MSIPTGICTILNIWHGRGSVVGFNDNIKGTPLTPTATYHKWEIIPTFGEDWYTITNVDTGYSAYTRENSKSGDPVVAGPLQPFVIKPIGDNRYTITTTDTNLYWFSEGFAPVTVSEDDTAIWMINAISSAN